VKKHRNEALETFRKRLHQRGLVRIEINVQREDAALVRSVAKALSDPKMAEEARSVLRGRFSQPAPVGLKALLSSVPLDDLDLERPRDFGREVDL
jgi:hypothetical protein